MIGNVKDFIYNNDMTALDKFFSDTDRLIAHADNPSANFSDKKFADELLRLTSPLIGDFEPLSSPLTEYWKDHYTPTLTSAEGRKFAAQWFANLYALLSGSFTKDMDFPDRDWDEIRETVNDQAEYLDMDILSTIMTTIVERGKT